MADFHGKTQVLVVDDERLIRMTLAARFRSIGYDAYCAGTVDEAVALLKEGGSKRFKAVITDIMMGDMDGFVFRDILRGMDQTIPIFFMTALDPEEGGGFLKKILEDANSHYLPKAIKTDTMLKRVQAIVASRDVEQLIERQKEEQQDSIELAAKVQRSLLPKRAMMDRNGFYTTWWHPKDVVSGDLYEAIPTANGGHIYILGDIQGHGTSAALAMTAVQSFLKQLALPDGHAGRSMEVHEIANMMQGFFVRNLAGVSYMTALICAHDPINGLVKWISCGAPDLAVIDPANPDLQVNPEGKGGLPIGLLKDTEYTEADTVTTGLSREAVCVAYSDGVLDLARDPEGFEQMDDALRVSIRNELLLDARREGSIMVAPYKFVAACQEYGYTNFADDVTELIFGATVRKPGVFKVVVPISATEIDAAAQKLGAWCEEEGWGMEIATKMMLVFEEKMMNLHDHAFDGRERDREVASVRLRKKGDMAELTIWDCGTEEPSIEVAAGNRDLAFELANRSFAGRGRGRLMLREMCNGIARSRFNELNETIYRIKFPEAVPEAGAAQE